MELKRFFEAIWILSPSTAMSCTLRGTFIEALHNPTVRTSIMSEFLVETLFGNMPLVLTNKLFKSPSGLILERCGIIRAVPIIMEKTEVHLDFHIFAILDFDLLIGYPFEKLFQEKPTLGSLNEENAFTTPISRIENPKAKHHDPFEEVKFLSPFVSPKPAYETE